MAALTYHMIVRDPGSAASWYESVLGATELTRIELPGGRVLTVDLRFGDSLLSVVDEIPEAGVLSPPSVGGVSGALHLVVDDVDRIWQGALEAGGTSLEEPHDAVWGDRTALFVDPFGHRWALDMHVRDVPAAEVARLVAEAFGLNSEES